MVHGTVKGLLGLVSTLVLIVLAVAAGLAYRLSQGPVSLSFLTPAFEDSLGKLTGGQTIELDDTELLWDAEHHTLSLRLTNVKARGPDNRLEASVPAASVSFSGPALLTGRLVLRGVRLIRPHLHILHTNQGGVALGLGEEVDADAAAAADSAVANTLDKSKQNPDRAAGPPPGIAGLERVEIDGGDLDFDDPSLHGHWHAPRVDLLVLKEDAGLAVTLRGPIEITQAGKTEPASLSLEGLYQPETGAASGTVHWTGLRPASLAQMAPILAPLGRFDLVTGGVADIAYSQADGLTTLGLDVTTGAGTIDATPWNGVLRVSAASIKGKLTNKLTALTLDDLRVDLGGAKIAASGRVTGLDSTAHLDVSARIDEMPVDMIKTLWPAILAPNPREWITTNMTGGTLRHAELKVVASAPISGSGETVVESLNGSMQGDGINVHYLGSMPVAHNSAATATFDKDSLTITVKGGAAGGVKVTGGTIKLFGFTSPEQAASFDLNFQSSVTDALKAIDAKPLGYTTALGFDPAHAKGDATIALNLSFPLVQKLQLSQVKMKVRAQTKGLGVPKVALGLDLSSGDFDINVDTQGMEVDGKAKLGAMPIDLQWHENFVKAAYTSRYQVKALLDEAGRKAVGLGDAAFQAPVIDGAMPVDVVATMQPGGKGDVDLKADLGPIAMRLPGLNWSKPKGAPGSAEAVLRLNAHGIVGIPRFSVGAAGGLDIRGDVIFDGTGHPRRITLATAKWGRSDLKGTVLFRPDGALGVDMSGASFDASELVAGGKGEHHVEVQQPLSLTAKLGKIWLSENGSIQNVAAVMARGPKSWRNIRVEAQLDKNQPLHIDIRPSDDKHRVLKITSSDAGATLSAFGLLEHVRGGNLTIDGTYNDADPKEPLTGLAKVSEYRIVNAPLLARILTIASLTGTLDVMSGSGIRFDDATVPFTLIDGVLTIKEGHTAGTELGITVDGQADLDHDQIAMQGTIVPAYALNSAVGKIPVIGDLLTGGKGSGLIAFSYSLTGKVSSPSVSVNPLSALTPGFLRGLFNVFDNGSGTKVDRTNTDADKKPNERPESAPAGSLPKGADR
ncbi:MAG TPA: AsmA-like C-terminal domain-containing protein [Magnetospirillaceae bacterium]